MLTLIAVVVALVRFTASAEAEAGCSQPFGLYGMTKDPAVATANLAKVVAVPAVTPQKATTAAAGALITADSSRGATPTAEVTNVSGALEPEVASVP